jgi:Trp operon repressor
MPESTTEGLIVAKAAELRDHRYKGLETLQEFIDDIIAKKRAGHAAMFSFVIFELLAANFEQKQLASLLGVSRASISRWSKGTKLPPQPMYREKVVSVLAAHLKEVITSFDPSHPDPSGQAHVATLPVRALSAWPGPHFDRAGSVELREK